MREHGILNDNRNYTFLTIKESPDFPFDHLSNDSTISWTKFIQSIFNAAELEEIELSSNEKIIVKNYEYVSQLKDTLKKLDLQPWDLTNYVGFKVFQIFQSLKNPTF